MINAIIGQIVCVNAQSVNILAGNIEFNIVISSQCATHLSSYQGSDRNNVRILTYLKHSEDSMTLYGFLDEEERLLFLELIKVSGIGPRQAIKILSAVKVKDLISALDKCDINFLSKIPGLGAKTSQKIVLALRDSLVFTSESNKPQNIAKGASHTYQDIVDALLEMGYDKKKILEVISKLLEDNKESLEGKTKSAIEEFIFRNAILSLN